MSSRETTIPRSKYRDHQRIAALAKYDDNPNRCGECGKKIEVGDHQKVAIVRKWKHCSLSCSATARWKRERELTGREKVVRGAHVSTVPFFKKGEVRSEQIRAHAKNVFKYMNIIQCELCGYNKTRPDVAHVRPISGFNEDALLLEINQRTQLVGLCPNCHREFDSGLVEVSVIEKIIAARGCSS